MRGVPAMDATAMKSLKDLNTKLANQNITLIFSHILEQPYSVMEKSGFVNEVANINFCANIDCALERAAQICQ